MLDDAIRNRVTAVLAPLRVVYGAMVGSILVYWVVVQVIRKVGQIPRGRDAFASVDWMRYPLYALGFAACVGILLMRRRLFDPARLILRARAAFRGWREMLWGMLLFDAGDFVMMRKMLLGIKARAEAHARSNRQPL